MTLSLTHTERGYTHHISLWQRLSLSGRHFASSLTFFCRCSPATLKHLLPAAAKHLTLFIHSHTYPFLSSPLLWCWWFRLETVCPPLQVSTCGWKAYLNDLVKHHPFNLQHPPPVSRSQMISPSPPSPVPPTHTHTTLTLLRLHFDSPCWCWIF